MRVIRILPEMKNSHFLSMFHQGISGQWPPSELPWDALASESAELRREVTLWAAPFACEGERAIRLTSHLIPKLSLAKATEAQLYLITLQLDKARQFHVFDRLLTEVGTRDSDGLAAPPNFAPYRLDDLDRPSGTHAATAKMWELYCVTSLSRALFSNLQGAIPSAWFQQVAPRILADQLRQLPFLQEYVSASISQESLESHADEWVDALNRSAESFDALTDPNLPFLGTAKRRGVLLPSVIEDAVRDLELQLDALIADCAGEAGEEAQFV